MSDKFYNLAYLSCVRAISCGGSSINSKGFSPTEGYMVSLKMCEQTYEMPEDTSVPQNLYDVIGNRLEDLFGTAKYIQNAYVGTWVDNSIIYVGISIRVDDLDIAKRFGIKEKQLSIYDVANDKAIKL